jgi:hypothetical protein
MLWRDALIMYDRVSRSLWSQVNGQAVAGPRKGQRLEEVPSEMTTWGEWKQKHPETVVLVKPPLGGSPYDGYFADPERIGVKGSANPDPRLPGKELVLGLERGARFAVVPLRLIEAQHVMNVRALGALLIVTPSAAYDRRAGGQTLTFDAIDSTSMRDRETQSRWSAGSGTATDGPMRGQKLDRISSKLVYWGVWARFHPRSEIAAH